MLLQPIQKNLWVALKMNFGGLIREAKGDMDHKSSQQQNARQLKLRQGKGLY